MPGSRCVLSKLASGPLDKLLPRGQCVEQRLKARVVAQRLSQHRTDEDGMVVPDDDYRHQGVEDWPTPEHEVIWT